MQTKGQVPQVEARPVPAYQPPPPVQQSVLNVQQNVVVKGRRNIGCLGSILVLIVFIICIVVCAGLFSTSGPSDHSSPPSSVKTSAKGGLKPNASEKPSQLTNAIPPTQGRDSKPEKSEQSEAKQNEPQTPRDKLAQLLATAMGKSNRENVQKISGLTIEAKEIRVEFAVDDNLTGNMIKSSARRDVVKVLKTIHESGIPYKSIDVYGTFSMADQFGNSTEERVISATYSKATVSRINWANFLPDNIYQIADTAVISPAFR